MPDDLIQSAAIGVAGSLLAFELVAAVRSWYDARASRDFGGDVPWRLVHRNPILVSQTFAIRDHFAERRHTLNRLRPQFAMLRTDRHGRQLRRAIGQVHAHRFGGLGADCPSCRESRLKGQPHCLECHRRLFAPALPA